MIPNTSRPLPLTIEEITPQWLTTALRVRAPGVTVRKVEVVNVKNGTCTKIRLNLDLDEAGQKAGIPKTVILKGGFEPHSRDYGFMHESEVRGYRDVFPVLKLPTPTCYFADYDPERVQGIIIMEDLVTRGVTFCNPLKPQTHEQVARRLSVLARYHAQTWDTVEFKPGGKWDWVRDVADTARKHFGYFLQPDIWQAFVDAPRGAAVATKFQDREWMDRVITQQVAFSAKLPQCLIHGDTHLGNLYIDADGSPGFFDSLVGRAPAMSEVSYHVCGALDLADRRRWEGALVRYYLDQLRANGVDAPLFDDAMHQYGIFLARGHMIFLVNDSHYQTEAINTAYTARFSQAMLDHDTVGLHKALG